MISFVFYSGCNEKTEWGKSRYGSLWGKKNPRSPNLKSSSLSTCCSELVANTKLRLGEILERMTIKPLILITSNGYYSLWKLLWLWDQLTRKYPSGRQETLVRMWLIFCVLAGVSSFFLPLRLFLAEFTGQWEKMGEVNGLQNEMLQDTFLVQPS